MFTLRGYHRVDEAAYSDDEPKVDTRPPLIPEPHVGTPPDCKECKQLRECMAVLKTTNRFLDPRCNGAWHESGKPPKRPARVGRIEIVIHKYLMEHGPSTQMQLCVGLPQYTPSTVRCSLCILSKNEWIVLKYGKHSREGEQVYSAKEVEGQEGNVTRVRK